MWDTGMNLSVIWGMGGRPARTTPVDMCSTTAASVTSPRPWPFVLGSDFGPSGILCLQATVCQMSAQNKSTSECLEL